MMRSILCLLLWVGMLAIPIYTVAMDEHDHGMHNHAEPAENSHQDHMNGENHHGSTETGAMAIVGSQVSKGVKGMAHLKDVSEIMGKLGLLTTHHFMIAFIDEASGAQIESGRVALVVTNPDAKVGETIKLQGMDGHFGADLVLDMKGEYHFRLGTELADGVKRKYHFHHVVE